MPARPSRHRQSAVVVAYVRPSAVAGKFADRLLAAALYDSGHQKYLAPPGGSIALQSSPRIAEARSQVVDEFIRPDGVYAAADWLWWLDADADFDHNTLELLMNVAHAEERPIIGALAFGGSNPENMFPTIYRMTPPAPGVPGWEMDRVDDYPRDALVKVGATGCHCVLVHKQVFRAMAARLGTRPDGTPNPYPWYMEGGVTKSGRPIGEDVSFCINAQALGIPVYVDTSIKTGHIKETCLDEAMWLRKQHEVESPVVTYRDFKEAG